MERIIPTTLYYWYRTLALVTFPSLFVTTTPHYQHHPHDRHPSTHSPYCTRQGLRVVKANMPGGQEGPADVRADLTSMVARHGGHASLLEAITSLSKEMPDENDTDQGPDHELRGLISPPALPSLHSSQSALPISADDVSSKTRPSITTCGAEDLSCRILPSAVSYLRSGTRFVGTQQSGRSTYDVSVELKHVNFQESTLCGYLRIAGLTEDNPTLTTYFEGEIIGPRFSFLTKHPDWGASEKTDLQHWARFASWRPLAKQARKHDFCLRSFAHKEHIYMRWKECFLVPDHHVQSISGASFAGFYYVCFNQITGDVSGLYYHQSSEKYQQLELNHVQTLGRYGVFEFR